MYALSFENMPRSFVLSVLLHGLLFVVLGVMAGKEYQELENNLVPKGVLLEMGTFSASAPALVPSKSAAPEVARKKVIPPVESNFYHKKDQPHPETQTSGASSLVGNATTGSGVNGPVGDPNGVAAGIRERYLYELKSVLEQNKRYPKESQMMGHEGKVTVGFTLRKDGSIVDVKLTEASPYSKLNEAALKLVRDLKNFKPIPPELGKDQWDLSIPINYSLN